MASRSGTKKSSLGSSVGTRHLTQPLPVRDGSRITGTIPFGVSDSYVVAAQFGEQQTGCGIIPDPQPCGLSVSESGRVNYTLGDTEW